MGLAVTVWLGASLACCQTTEIVQAKHGSGKKTPKSAINKSQPKVYSRGKASASGHFSGKLTAEPSTHIKNITAFHTVSSHWCTLPITNFEVSCFEVGRLQDGKFRKFLPRRTINLNSELRTQSPDHYFLVLQQEEGRQQRPVGSGDHLQGRGRGGYCKGGAKGSGGLPERPLSLHQARSQDALWGAAVRPPWHWENPSG